MKHNDSRSQSKSIGIVKLRSLGDSILTSSFIQSVQLEFPQSEITYYLPENFKELFQSESYKIKGVPKNFKDLFLFNEFRTQDLLFVLHASHRLGVIAKASGVKNRIVHHHGIHEKDTGSNYIIPERNSVKSVLERDLDSLRAFTGNAHQVCMPKLNGFISPKKEEGILFLVGGSRPTKIYPYYKELIRKFKLKGKKTIVISEHEPSIDFGSNEIIYGLSLKELAQAISKYKYVIGNDSGIFHLSKALGLKSLCIVGPENPKEWHPYKDPIAYFEIPCRNEGNFPYNYCTKVECRHLSCLSSQKPEYLFEKFAEFFGENL